MAESTNKPVTAFAYIQSWIGRVNVEAIVANTEQAFKGYGQPYKVINTTDNVYNKEGWIDLGNVWGFKSFHAALKDFDMSYDYMLYMSGDIVADESEWLLLLNRAYEVLNKYSVGCYSIEKVDSTGQPQGTNAYIGTVAEDKFLKYTSTNDLTIAFYDRETVKFLLDAFNYIETKIKLSKMRWGWGIEAAASAICIYNKKALLKDTKFTIKKASSSTPHIKNEAMKEEYKFLNVFCEYCSEQNMADMQDVLERKYHSLVNNGRLGFYGLYDPKPNIYK